jgi:redox-sensing transcriptional repressor
MDGISKETIQRLPSYLRFLKELKQNDIENVSSTVIADKLNLNPVQVRKDFAGVSLTAGKPKTGFVVNDLINDISEFLGYNDANEAVIVGVGQLGKALLSYTNFQSYGLQIVAGFDSYIGSQIDVINKRPVFNIDKLNGFVKRMDIYMGIIAVPKENAQEVCDQMIDAGIRAIWNFAPTNLKVPADIALKNEDMASSLAVLSKRLSEILKNDKK